MARLLEGTGVNANNGIISGVLVTVGDLARVVGELWFYRLLAIRKQKVFFFLNFCVVGSGFVFLVCVVFFFFLGGGCAVMNWVLRLIWKFIIWEEYKSLIGLFLTNL